MNHPPTLPKLCGADIELANFILGAIDTRHGRGTGANAARALLREIDGVPAGSFFASSSRWPSTWGDGNVSYGYGGASYGYGGSSYGHGGSSHRHGSSLQWIDRDSVNPQDIGRKFLATNGGCAYIDLAHLELCIPEVLSAYDHAACWHAMIRLAQRALSDANAHLPAGFTIKLLANNSDGKGHSYGSHINILLTRRCWDNIFKRRPHHALFLASYLASAIVFTGTGKVGSENERPHTGFQLSQRADFLTSFLADRTTYDRPLLNSRDESHAENRMARLHLIALDSTLAPGACVLKVGVTQLVLALLEQERIAPLFFLEDPIGALHAWSRDPDLRTTAEMVDGGRHTALDVQWQFLERVRRLVDEGCVEGLVPRARDIVDLWEDTLSRLGNDPDSLAGRLDWVLKRRILRQAREQHGLDWDAPGIAVLDQVYHSLDPEEGLFWAYDRQGVVEHLFGDDAVDRFLTEPPDDTRAYARAHLLRRGDTDAVEWNRVRLDDGRTVDMDDPLRFTRADVGEPAGDAILVERVLAGNEERTES
jgi:proteasome accessory factor A